MFLCFKFRSNQFFQNLNIISVLLALIFCSMMPSKSYSQTGVISSIVVNGNKRIATSTIINISKIDEGMPYTQSQINSSLQQLKSSSYFEYVDIKVNNGKLIIKVVEKPTINSINFEGNNNLQDDKLYEIISSTERQTLSASKAEHDAERIADAYVATGRISAQVTPKIIKL